MLGCHGEQRWAWYNFFEIPCCIAGHHSSEQKGCLGSLADQKANLIEYRSTVIHQRGVWIDWLWSTKKALWLSTGAVHVTFVDHMGHFVQPEQHFSQKEGYLRDNLVEWRRDLVNQNCIGRPMYIFGIKIGQKWSIKLSHQDTGISWVYKDFNKWGGLAPLPSVHATGINAQIWWEPPPTYIVSIPVSAALSLNDFKQGRLHGSQTLLTYMQGNITMKTWMERCLFSIKTCEVCVCVFVRAHTHALWLLGASVSLCICVCRRSCIQKRSSTRCHTQTYKCRFNRNNPDLPHLSVIMHLPHTPFSLNPYFTLIFIYFFMFY